MLNWINKSPQATDATRNGLLNKDQANAALSAVKAEDPGIFNYLPDELKQKFANGITTDMFTQMDPLGVTDGLINREEMTKWVAPDSGIDTGNGKRGGTNVLTEGSAYVVKNGDGKWNADLTAQNIIGDFENLLQGETGNIVNGNVNKDELGKIISKYQAAGQADRVKTAELLYDGYDSYKNANGDIDVPSLVTGLKKLVVNNKSPWA